MAKRRDVFDPTYGTCLEFPAETIPDGERS
jgi:hypothetical protein